MSFSLLRVGWRSLVRRPLQSLLVIVGIALGVAVIVAIDLANGSASRAFELSTEAVTGRATHQIVGGPAGVPPEVYVTLRRDLALREVAPVVTDFVGVEELGDRPMRLLGVDSFAEAPFRSYVGGDNNPVSVEELTRFLTQPATILLSRDVARAAGVGVDDSLTLQIDTRRLPVTVAGLLAPADDLSRRALDGLLLADIATAQELLGVEGRLTTIDLILPPGPAGASAAAAIEARLPEGVRLVTAATRTETVAQLSAAFETNLTALSLLALVVGMFLIYNTVTFSVVQRRPVLGTLRALGVTREEVGVLILGEALVMGVIGAAAGLLLGALLGRGVVGLVTQTINDLYFVVNVTGIDPQPATFVKGALIGIAAAVGAAALPAWEAASVPPVTALRRSSIEQATTRLLPRLTAAALLFAALGGGALLLSGRSLLLAFAALFAVILAFAFLTPLVTVLTMRAAAPPLARLGLLGRLAPRDLIRSLSRTSVAIAALMVAVSVIIGVSIMITSFRGTVTLWLDNTLRADVYVRAPSFTATRAEAPLSPDLVTEIAAIEGVERVLTARDVTVASPELGELQLVAASEDVAGDSRPFKWIEGSPDAAWARAKAGEGIFVTEPFTFRHNLGPGDPVTLLTDVGPRTFPIVAIYYDYASDQGAVLLPDPVYRSLFNDPFVSSIALYVEPGVEVDQMVSRLQERFAGRESLVIGSNRGLRENVLEIFDRAFAITGALQLLATIVAFIGVLAALMALQLERARELGTLRAVGMTRRQLWGLTMLETGLMGGTAGLWAMPVGLVLALILIFVINRRAFGWTLQLRLTPETFLQALAVALIAALLAGLYPALRISRLRIERALRSE